MSDLEFLSSDEEEEKEEATSPTPSISTGNKKGKLSQKKANKKSADDNGDSDDSGDEFGNDFEFGGLLGEDGRGDDPLSSLLIKRGGSTGAESSSSWSYQSALKILKENDRNGKLRPERTDVASIIAAARSNMKKKGEEDDNDVEVDEESDSESGKGEMDDDDHDAGSNSESSESDSDSSDDEVDDALQAKAMEEDVVRFKQVRRRKDRIQQATDEAEESRDDEENGVASGDDDSDDDDDASSDGEDDEEARLEKEKAAKFFESSTTVNAGGDGDDQDSNGIEVFAQLNLSRPLLRGVASIGFVTPTPIQARVIPIALSGRDICASAQTGSGKTAAFLLPTMERILSRGGGRVQMKSSSSRSSSSNAATSATRGLVLTPTRELAAQCLSMMTVMAKFTGLRAALIVGGAKNINAQAAELRTRPDIVIATPGRLLDHITNSAGVDMDDLEFLILDEADRLLDLGFQDEIHEIIKACPVERQTLLFSATMGTKVDDLIKLSLKRPVRIHVTTKKDANSGGSGEVEVANRLEQEFIRVRASNEGVNREAMLLALLTRTYTHRVIVFFDTKAEAHRLMIICGLCGIKVAELHGNLTQVQRLEALESFREGAVDVLLATDLAARGLDISSVQAVVNFEMPSQVESYVHRIGRTARAGRGGKACTLIGEGRRPLMKAVIKDAEQKRLVLQKKASRGNTQKSIMDSTGAIRSRTIPTAVLKHFAAKIISLESHIEEVIAAEAVAKMDRIAEMEANKAKNLIQHGADIEARPRREWFATNQQKLSAKEAAMEKQKIIAEKVGTGLHRMTRKKRRLREAKEELQAMQDEAYEEYEETGQKSKQIMTDNAITSYAKAHKRKQSDMERERDQRSLYDEDTAIIKRKEKKAKKRKGAFASDSLGDQGLFADELVVHGQKSKKSKPAQSSYNFVGYDPDKPTRKHKVKSHHGFKSRSKFKRK